MGYVANFACFPAMKNFENRLKFDKVTVTLKVKTFFETQCRSFVYTPDDHSHTKLEVCYFAHSRDID